jgi:hypothetical protein
MPDKISNISELVEMIHYNKKNETMIREYSSVVRDIL